MPGAQGSASGEFGHSVQAHTRPGLKSSVQKLCLTLGTCSSGFQAPQDHIHRATAILGSADSQSTQCVQARKILPGALCDEYTAAPTKVTRRPLSQERPSSTPRPPPRPRPRRTRRQPPRSPSRGRPGPRGPVSTGAGSHCVSEDVLCCLEGGGRELPGAVAREGRRWQRCKRGRAHLGELALLHALADVPVHEGALGVHQVELVVDARVELGDRGGIGHHRDGAHDLGEVATGNDRRRLVVNCQEGREPA